MTDMVGQKIAHYHLEDIIGDGGMGTVYRARDDNLERTVAVKVMHAHFARLEEFRARLTQEAKTAAQLDHPSIVRIYDFGQYDGGLYIAMEYVAGGSLRAHIKRLQSARRYLPLPQSLQIARQIANALDYAHRQGVVHRDVKPSNIILKRLSRPDSEGEQPFRAILTDFGLVKLLGGASMTQTGTTMGTPAYMSPEQCQGESIDGRSDLYSLGVVLYELIANRPPFGFKSLSEAMAAHLKGEMPTKLSDVRPDVPPVIDGLVTKALAKSPNRRFVSGREMADAIDSAIRSLDSHATILQARSSAATAAVVASGSYQSGLKLNIRTPGRDDSFAELSKGILSVGRNADNDVVLAAEGVSRHHAIIEEVDGSWYISDLGGLNGSWLDDQRLRPNEPVLFDPGSILEIGPYQLILVGHEKPAADAVATTVEDSGTSNAYAAVTPIAMAAMQNDTSPTPLALFLARERIPINPGEQTEVLVEVANRGEITDFVTVRVLGIPSHWVTLPSGFQEVPPDENITLPILIHPPRSAVTPAGRQRFRIELRSQRYTELAVGESASLLIGTFDSFEVSLEPKEVKLPGLVRTTIKNTGNETNTFSVIGRDRGDHITFEGEKGRIVLQSGQIAAVDLRLEPRQRGWFGESARLPFEVEVISANGASQTVSATGTASPLLPSAFLYLALFFVVFLCALAGLFLIFGRGDFFSGSPTQPSDIPAIAQTATMIAAATETAAVTATNAAGTSAAETAVSQGDRDNDGLSDTQEEIIGTDPDNPDTDGDSLSDGEEVLTWGTNPQNRDTDGDVLIDGDEVHTYGTEPTNPDTDGDGIPDGVEIATGTDPLDPLDPPPTGTATVEVATETPTAVFTPTPTETSSNTPTPTNTDIPSPTATQTPIPPATATSTPTATPTPTPTNTTTPASTAVTPASVVGCSIDTPTIDGIFNPNEWPEDPTYSFAPDDDATRQVSGYLVWVGNQLYSATLISDATENQSTDSVKIYYDANNNGGDPDNSDRFYQVVRDGTMTIRAGIGTNNDGRDWNSEYTSDNWDAVTGNLGASGWLVEMQIDAPNEMPDMLIGQPFGTMVLVLYTGSQGVWPQEAISNNASTWQQLGNTSCR